MKTLLSLIVVLMLLPLVALSQALDIKRKNISSNLVEAYETSGTNKKQKHGTYVVMNHQNQIVLEGKYENGKRVGQWNGYSETGKLIQKYDYDQGKLLLHANDTTSLIEVVYTLGETAPKSALVEAPLKIGGSTYGFNLLYDDKIIPAEVINQRGDVVMSYELGISENGKLESWTVHFNGQYVKKTAKKSLKGLPADAFEFIPATVDGQPVKSNLYYAIKLSVGELKKGRRTNEIVTY